MDYNLILTLSGEETLQVILSLCILLSFHYVSTNEHTVYRCVLFKYFHRHFLPL